MITADEIRRLAREAGLAVGTRHILIPAPNIRILEQRSVFGPFHGLKMGPLA